MSSKVIKAPHSVPELKDSNITIFLGGSIEMGAAENWQDKLCKEFANDDDLIFLNPRRDDWDSSWDQTPVYGTKFYEQVTWELENQDMCDIIVYYFDPNTKSPITLLELGSYGTSYTNKVLTCCPDGFWRKGNVVMFCNYHGVKNCNTFSDLISMLKSEIYVTKLYKEKLK